MPGDQAALFGPAPSYRARTRNVHEEAGAELTDALFEDLASMQLQDAEVCERSGIDRPHFSRVKARQAHPPESLIAFAIGNSRHRPARYLVVSCALGEHEPKPKPPPSVGDVLEAYRAELADMKLDSLVRERVERRLGVVLAPGHQPIETSK